MHISDGWRGRRQRSTVAARLARSCCPSPLDGLDHLARHRIEPRPAKRGRAHCRNGACSRLQSSRNRTRWARQGDTPQAAIDREGLADNGSDLPHAEPQPKTRDVDLHRSPSGRARCSATSATTSGWPSAMAAIPPPSRCARGWRKPERASSTTSRRPRWPCAPAADPGRTSWTSITCASWARSRPRTRS